MREGKNRSISNGMTLYSAILGQITVSILIGIFAGKYIDRSFHTDPLFLVIGLLLGLFAGILAMLHTVRHFFSGE